MWECISYYRCDVGTEGDGNLCLTCNTLKDKVKLNYSTAGN